MSHENKFQCHGWNGLEGQMSLWKKVSFYIVFITGAVAFRWHILTVTWRVCCTVTLCQRLFLTLTWIINTGHWTRVDSSRRQLSWCGSRTWHKKYKRILPCWLDNWLAAFLTSWQSKSQVLWQTDTLSVQEPYWSNAGVWIFVSFPRPRW